MKIPDDNGRLHDILDAARRIGTYVRGVSEHKFKEDAMRQDAVAHQIEIIGEAARNISSDFQKQHSEIPWSEMIGMRNRLIHDYFEIDVNVLWKTARVDIPKLKTAIAVLLKKQS